MNPQLISAAAALVLVLAAGVWRAASSGDPLSTKAPTTKAPPVEYLTASPPVISPFTAFYVNDLNPFVPYAQRIAQAERMRNPGPQLPPAKPAEPPPKPAEPRPALVLPKLHATHEAVPQCVGLVAARRGDARAIMVRMKPGDAAAAVTVGDEVAGWRLDAIDGPTARWTAPGGDMRTFLIAPTARSAVEVVPHGEGSATTPVAPAKSGSAAHSRDPGVADDPTPPGTERTPTAK